MQASPRQLVFGRDMVLPIKYVTDWERLHQVRQRQINRDNARENRNCIEHTYKAGDKVLVNESWMMPKLDALRTGPYLVKKIWSNGTITVKKDNITKRWIWDVLYHILISDHAYEEAHAIGETYQLIK